MIKFKEEVNFFYDERSKMWSGDKYRPFYSKDSSIGKILYEELRRHPKRTCQISDSEETQLTNEEVLLQAVKIAKYFESLDIKQSDIIGIAARNTTNLLGLVLACFFHGSAFHAINPVFDKKTAKHIYGITKPKLIFCDGDILEKIQYAVSDWNPPILTMNHQNAGISSLTDILKSSDQVYFYEPATLDQGPDQTLCILCSSGSTGLPKAVTIPNSMRAFEYSNYLTDEDVQFVFSIIEWITCIISIICSIIYGAKRIITHRPVTPEYFLEVVHKYKVTYVLQAPCFMASLLNCKGLSNEKLNSLRYFTLGGGKCTLQTQNKLQSYLNNGKMIFVYGLTEFNQIAARNFDLKKKPNSVGRLGPGVKAKLIGNDGTYLGPNEVGEILLYNGMPWRGYVNNAEATSEMYDDAGWFHTGDLAYFDEDGYLYIVDRKKDLLKYQEMHYTPSEVEEIIANIPDVTDVCVFGVWTELNGDEAAAAVVTKPGSSLAPEDVLSYVENNTSEFHKHLHAGAVIWDELPKMPNGKVDRAAIKRKFIEQKEKEKNLINNDYL